MAKLRIDLLSETLSSKNDKSNKYSNAYLNLSAIMRLEQEESTESRIPEKYFEIWKKIQQKSNNIEGFESIPLLILEQYYFRNSSDLARIITVSYGDQIYKPNVKIYDLFLALEEFYMELYLLACKIADYYSYDYKTKDI